MYIDPSECMYTPRKGGISNISQLHPLNPASDSHKISSCRKIAANSPKSNCLKIMQLLLDLHSHCLKSAAAVLSVNLLRHQMHAFSKAVATSAASFPGVAGQSVHALVLMQCLFSFRFSIPLFVIIGGCSSVVRE